MITIGAPGTGSTDHLTSEIQHALAKLADVETGIEVERGRLEQWSGPAEEKERLLAQLAAERQRRREPLTLLLAELHQRLTKRSLYRPLH